MSEKGSELTDKLLIDDDDKMRVEEVLSPDSGTSYFSIYCQTSDQGKVIGRGGENVKAIRKLAFSIAMAQYKRRCEVSVDQRGNSDYHNGRR